MEDAERSELLAFIHDPAGDNFKGWGAPEFEILGIVGPLDRGCRQTFLEEGQKFLGNLRSLSEVELVLLRSFKALNNPAKWSGVRECASILKLNQPNAPFQKEKNALQTLLIHWYEQYKEDDSTVLEAIHTQNSEVFQCFMASYPSGFQLEESGTAVPLKGEGNEITRYLNLARYIQTESAEKFHVIFKSQVFPLIWKESGAVFRILTHMERAPSAELLGRLEIISHLVPGDAEETDTATSLEVVFF
jgi:hypothetical protein